MNLIRFVLWLIASRIVYAKVYFSNENLIIHANKNITNFNPNLKVFESIIENLSQLDNKLLSFPNMPKTVNLSKTNKTWITSDFNKYLDEDVKLCISHLQDQKNEIHEIIKNALNSKDIDKRGFPILGSLFSGLTDMPSPEEWTVEVN